MTKFQAMGLVIRREIIERARSKAFIASAVVTILLVVVALGLPILLETRDTTYTLGVVGDGSQEVVDAAVALANPEDADSETTIDVVVFDDLSEAEASADSDDVDGVLVNGSELVVRGAGGAQGDDLEDLLQYAARSVKIDELTAAGQADVVELLTSDPLDVRSLSGADTAENTGRAIVAVGGLFLMYIAVLSYGSWTLAGVTEEKTNRVVEVLLATLEPWQLLAGKIIGIGLLGLTQFVGTAGIALVAIRVTGAFDLPAVPIDSLLMLILWFILGYSLFAVAFGAAGALVSRAEDAQSTATPITLVAVAGFFAAFQAVDDPTSVFAGVATYVPITAPFVVPIRFAFKTIPWWEIVLAVAVMSVTILLLIRFASRVYSGGLLHFGGRLKYREAYRSAELG